MEVTIVRVNVGITKNMGNYESLRIDYAVEAELDEDEMAKTVISTLRKELTEKIVADLNGADGGREWLRKPAVS